MLTAENHDRIGVAERILVRALEELVSHCRECQYRHHENGHASEQDTRDPGADLCPLSVPADACRQHVVSCLIRLYAGLGVKFR